MWQLKVLKDTAKALLPFQDRLRELARGQKPYQPEPGKIAFTVEQGLDQFRLLKTHGYGFDGVVAELGTGWFPTLPLMHLAAGADSVILTDIERLMDDNTFNEAKEAVISVLPSISDLLDRPVAELRANLERQERIDYRVPCDVCTLDTGSIDLFLSRAVLEHVPPESIHSIFSAASRFLKPSGMMIHTIDNSDHFAHQDKSIGLVNFLRYSPSTWRLTGLNPQTYTNRLRHDDYAEIFRDCGFAILGEKAEPHEAALTSLQTLPLAAQYRHIPKERLAIIETVILAAKAEGNEAAVEAMN